MREDLIKEELFAILDEQLAEELTYHSIHHTKDVLGVCKFYIDHYKIDDHDASLLRIAAAGHDVGFIETYRDHEEASARITTELMQKHDYSKSDIEIVSSLIMATKIPQDPNTFLATILCDADLDYLGRDDFETIGHRLKEEWQSYSIFHNLDEIFDTIQIKFLTSHSYHTDYAREHRAPVKMQHLEKLEAAEEEKERAASK